MGHPPPLSYALQNLSRFVAELKDFIGFPTVSAQTEHAGDLKGCVKWLADHLRWIGLKNVRVISTAGQPIVYADWLQEPALIDRSHLALRAAAVAYRAGFGRALAFLRSGGTIPIVNTILKIFGIPTILMGFALPDDQMYAPNEKFHLPNFRHCIPTSIHFLNEIAHTLKRPI